MSYERTASQQTASQQNAELFKPFFEAVKQQDTSLAEIEFEQILPEFDNKTVIALRAAYIAHHQSTPPLDKSPTELLMQLPMTAREAINNTELKTNGI